MSAFLRDKTRWPTYEEFAEAGLKGLRDVLPRFGGLERWSQEMGLQEGPRPWGGVVRWTDEAIRAALTQFMTGRSVWPTHPEFRQAGLGGLYAKLRQEGTLEQWANEIGVAAPRPKPQFARHRPASSPQPADPTVRQDRRWTDERIAAELAAFLGKREEWPRYTEFVAADRLRLYKAVIDHGGTRHWARQMQVRWVARRDNRDRTGPTSASAGAD